MDNKDKIRSAVAQFFKVPEAEVTEGFVFPAARLQGAVGRSALQAALKRIAGVDLAAAFTANTYGELVNAPGARPSSGAAVLAVGIDLENADNLPDAKDPWTEAFYAENFTSAEIAYCTRQADPRLSFCGLWCAKEAAMKCGPAFAGLSPKEIEITHDEDRRPGLCINTAAHQTGLSDWLLSISHAGRIAVAMCLLRPAAIPAPAPGSAAPSSAQPDRTSRNG